MKIVLVLNSNASGRGHYFKFDIDEHLMSVRENNIYYQWYIMQSYYHVVVNKPILNNI